MFCIQLNVCQAVIIKFVHMKKHIFKFQLLVLFLFAGATFATAQKNVAIQSEKRELRKNMIITEYNTDAKGGNKWMDHKTVYDPNGFKIEEIEYATYGMRERILFEYDANGLCVKEVVFDERNKVSRIRKYQYNPDGTKKTQYNYLPNGKLFSTKQYVYAVK